MARVLTYNRPVDVITGDSFDCGSGWSGPFLKIKEEVDGGNQPTDGSPDKKSTLALCNNSNNLSEKGHRPHANSHIQDPGVQNEFQKLYMKYAKDVSRINKTGHNTCKSRLLRKTGLSAKEFMRRLSIIQGDVQNLSAPECHICFLKMDSPPAVAYHYRNFMSTAKFACSICNLTVCSKRMLHAHVRTTHDLLKQPKRFHSDCHFCGQKFVLKSSLQSHLFHFHSDDIYFRTETPMKFNQNDNIPNQTNTSKPDFMPQKERDCKNLPTKEHLPTEQCMETEMINFPKPSTENKHTPKKMRQTTLTEFIKFSSPKGESSANLNKTPTKEFEEKGIKLSPENSNQLLNSSKPLELKPFVKIHVPPEEYIQQLSGGRSQKAMTTRSHNWVRRSTRYSLRQSISVNHENDPPNLANVSSVQKSVELNETALDTHTLSDTDTKLAMKYKCKTCSVPLVKCDAKANNLPKADPRDVIVPVKQQNLTHLPKLSEGGHLMLKELEVSLERIPIEKVEKTLEVSEPVTNDQVHRKGTFVCKVCDKVFCSKEEKKQHTKTTHTAYMSSICNARYTFKHKLIEHYLRQHYLFKRNECCVCGEPCSDRMALRRHLLLHCIKIIQSKEDTTPVNVEVTCKSYHKTNKCSGCGKSFWLYSCLQQHQIDCQKCKRTEDNENDGCVIKGKFPTIKLHDAGKEDEVVDKTSPPCEDSANDSSNNPNLAVTTASTEHVTETQTISMNPPEINIPNMDPSIFQNQNSQATSLADSLRLADTNSALPSSSTATVNDAKTKYYCDTCGRQYQTYKNLQQHLRMFTNLVGEPCNICGTVFGSIRLLRAHFNAAHIPEIVRSYNYHCSFCNQGFCKKDSLRMHELHLHSRQLTPVNADRRTNIASACKVCNLIFECRDRFEEHIMYYDNDQMFTCGFCGQCFRGMYMLHHHNKLVHYPQFTTTSYNYTCGTCGEGFNHETHFYAHKVHVHSVNPLSPDLFNKASQDKRPVIAMDESVTNKLDNIVTSTEPTFICLVCGMSFSNLKELAYHESQFSDDGSYLCDLCSKRFRSLVFLTKHQVLTHSSCEVVNEFMCNICKEVFTSKVSLTCHEKHFHCNVENTLPSDLTNVDGDQTSDKKCSICDLELKSGADLVDHVLQYANHGNYDCDVCHRKFYYSAHLKQHQISHSLYNSGSPQTGCGICKESFSSIAVANSHNSHLHKHKDLSTVASTKVMNVLEETNSNDKNLDISTKNTQTPEVDTATGREGESVGGSASILRVHLQSPGSEVLENINDETLKIQAMAKNLILELKNKGQVVKCDVCNVQFATKKDLDKHREKFQTTGEFVCEFCGAKFLWESVFHEHHRKHVYEMNGISLEHSCHICNEKFRTSVGAQLHISHCHSRSKQLLQTNWNPKQQSSEKQHEPPQSCLQSECGEVEMIDNTNNCTSDNVDRFAEEKDPPQSSESDEVNILDDVLDQTDNTNTPLENSGNQTRTTRTIRTQEIKIVNDDFSNTDNYTCPVCLKTFISLSHFQKHFREVHPKASSEHRSRNYSTQLLKVTPETQGIACVICNAVFSNPVGFKKHLNTVHMPRMNLADNMKKRFVKIIKKIPLVPHVRPTQTVDTVGSNQERARTVEQPNTSISNTSKKLSIDKHSEVKQQNKNVGKLKVKDFAKITDRQDSVPNSEITKMNTSCPTDKYVILQPETRSEIYFASYINNLSKNDDQNL